jgi:hypothetical protein
VPSKAVKRAGLGSSLGPKTHSMDSNLQLFAA